MEWMDSDPTGQSCDFLVVLGDLNAYAQEEPIKVLEDGGYINSEPSTAYSFVFDGQIGTLDYLLYKSLAEPAKVAAGVWHINEDEADALDYNTDFGRDVNIFDGSSPARNSDHSPLLVLIDTCMCSISEEKDSCISACGGKSCSWAPPMGCIPAPIDCDCHDKDFTNGGDCKGYCGNTCKWTGRTKTCSPSSRRL